MAEHHQAFVGPQIEVSEPKLLINLGDQPVHLRQAVFRHLEIECAGQMQGFEIFAPIERDVIIRPGAGDHQCQFVVARAVRCPIVGGCQLFEKINRIYDALIVAFGRCHSKSSFSCARTKV